MTELLQCPQCERHLLLKRNEDVYACVACDFKKDFAKPEKAKSSEKQENALGWAALLVLLVFVLDGWSRGSGLSRSEAVQAASMQAVNPALPSSCTAILPLCK